MRLVMILVLGAILLAAPPAHASVIQALVFDVDTDDFYEFDANSVRIQFGLTVLEAPENNAQSAVLDLVSGPLVSVDLARSGLRGHVWHSGDHLRRVL